MLAPMQERRAAGSRALVLLGAVCALSGLVAWGSYAHAPASTGAPALALYTLPAGLRSPVAVPGPQAAPVVSPSAMVPSSSPGATMPMPAAPAAPVAAPHVMNPTPFLTMPQAPPGQPFVGPAPQAMPQAVKPSETGTFLGPLQMFFLGLAAGGAVVATISKKLKNNMNEAQDTAELGMHPRRAGVPTMFGATGADALLEEFFLNFPIIFSGILVAYLIVDYVKRADWIDTETDVLTALPIPWEFLVVPVLAIVFAFAGKVGILQAGSGIVAKLALDAWNVFASAVLPGAILKY